MRFVKRYIIQLHNYLTYIIPPHTQLTSRMQTVDNFNFSCNETEIISQPPSPVQNITTESGITDMFEISYMYMGTAGFLVAIVVGICVSYATGPKSKSTLHNGVLFKLPTWEKTSKSYDMVKETHNKSFVGDFSTL